MATRNCGSKTPVREIIDYWEARISELNFAVDWADADEVCWRCGHEGYSLHKCHIVPHSLGGNDTASNLVLLCGRCHLENPNTDDREFFWLWMRAHHKRSLHGLYDTYWTMRGMEEFRTIFGREPYSKLDPEIASTSALNAAFKSMIGRVGKHFGENGLNPATIAWILYKTEEYLLNMQTPNPGFLFEV